MNKLKTNNNEKYYTPEKLYNKMYEILQENNIQPTEFLENSAGDGRMIDFLSFISEVPVIAYDIHNETNRSDIKECNYLKEKIEYKKGRVAFINPPFSKALYFIKKSLEECDYCLTVCSVNTIINLDYNKYEAVGNIYYIKKFQFDNAKVDIAIMLIKKK